VTVVPTTDRHSSSATGVVDLRRPTSADLEGRSVSLELEDDTARRLPQGCQIEAPYRATEWAAFLECARDGYDTGECLDNEFYEKMQSHQVSDTEVRLAFARAATLVAYRDEDQGRVALWHRGLLVIARESNGKVFNAFPLDDLDRMLRAKRDVRVLKQ